MKILEWISFTSLKLIVIIIGTIAVGIFVLWWTTPRATIRYRLTITASVDGALRTGSGVIEVKYESPPPFLMDSPGTNAYLRGEAIVVDLGSRGKLFALLHTGPGRNSSGYSRTPRDYVPYLWRSENPRNPPPNATTGRAWLHWVREHPRSATTSLAWLTKLKGTKVLPLDHLPFLVRFRDVNDPKSVEWVLPDNLTASFGSGVQLVSASVEITDAPITRGIRAQLPWLRGLVAKAKTHFATNLNGTVLIDQPEHSVAGSLVTSYFISGEE